MFGKVYTGTVHGIEGILITAEADVGGGFPAFEMVGYLGAEVREARERVRTAIRNAGFYLGPSRITVNLSPADIRKQGNSFDLPVALAVLTAAGYIKQQAASDRLFIGELGLDGSVRGIHGVLPILDGVRKAGIKRAVVPDENLVEAQCVEGIEVCGVSDLKEIVRLLNYGEYSIREKKKLKKTKIEEEMDFSDMTGQEAMKRAAVIAASGMHNILYIGAPGTGKSMAARRLPSILPPMTAEEKTEVTKIYSIAGRLSADSGLVEERPFRNPHHTVSPAALSGGGNPPRPGEISLAHNGVLFLDELAEFRRESLEAMRQPMEEGYISICRTKGNYRFPARFLMAGAANACKCGYFPDRTRCRCTSSDIRHYMRRLSGPLLDRIDICSESLPVQPEELIRGEKGTSSAQMKEQVMLALERQRFRYESTGLLFNSQLNSGQIKKYCRLGHGEELLLKEALSRLGLSPRSKDKVLRVSRTIADISGCENINEEHMAEAIGYRSIDRKYWNEL